MRDKMSKMVHRAQARPGPTSRMKRKAADLKRRLNVLRELVWLFQESEVRRLSNGEVALVGDAYFPY